MCEEALPWCWLWDGQGVGGPGKGTHPPRFAPSPFLGGEGEGKVLAGPTVTQVWLHLACGTACGMEGNH